MTPLESLRPPTAIDRITREFTRLPPKGTPAAELTNRDKLALAIAAGVPYELVFEGLAVTLRSRVPFSITDRGDGGWDVAHLYGGPT